MPTITLYDEDRKGGWDPLIGTMVGSWRVARRLGQGGMGAVFLARHPTIGAKVAVKLLHERYQGDRGAIERFFNEARAVNLIGHENIVKVLDFNVLADGRRYFVMEFLEGTTLHDLVAAKQPVPLAVAGPILLQMTRALHAAHERGIVHRDLKPDNVFLVSQMGRKHFVKLVDFGIAKLESALGAEGAHTEAGVVLGTPAYMSPEQAAGRIGEIGRRSDVYSLGVVMYQLATGRVPFEGPSTAETLVMHLQQKPPRPRELAPGIPAAYEELILRALEKKREDRFQSMQELHDALAACLAALGISSELPLDDGPPLRDEPEEPALAPVPAPREERVPLTQTSMGQATLAARLVRGLEWLLAPRRRVAVVVAAFALIGGFALLVAPRSRPLGPTAPQPPPVVAPPQVAVKVPPTPSPVAPQPMPEAVAPPPAVAAPPHKTSQRPPGKAAQPAAVAAPAPSTRPPGPPRTATPPRPVRAPKATGPGSGPSTAAAVALAPPDPLLAPTAADTARALKLVRDEKEAAARAIREMTESAQRVAGEESKQPPASARLFVVSEPLGASATVAWNGKSAAGQTPFVFKVRRGAQVTVTLSKPGYAPSVQQLEAKVTQAVVVTLKAEAR